MQNRISKPRNNDRSVLLSCPKLISVTESHSRSRKKRENMEKQEIKVDYRKRHLFISITQRSVPKLSVIEIRRVVCGWVIIGWVVVGSAAWLAGWLVEANERTRPLVQVPFTLMTKNWTSLNGTDEWLWKQHLICIEGASLSTRWKSECSSLVRALSLPSSRSISHPSASRWKGHCPLSIIYSIVYFIQITRRPRPKQWISLWLPIAAHCDDARTDDDAYVRRIRRASRVL